MITLPAYGWKPRPDQAKAWNALQAGVKTGVLAWHRQMGKDELALHNAAIKAMERVGNYWHLLPKQEQARKAIWEAVNPNTGRVRWKDAFPPEIIKHVDNQAMKLTLVTGSTWQVLGSDNFNSLVGSVPVGMTLSEAALSDPNAFGFFRPILVKNGGWSLHISSTRGKNHFHRLFKATEQDPEGFAQHLSAEDTQVFTPAQLGNELRTYCALYGEAYGRALYEQEYLSRWEAANPGAVWGPEIDALEKDGRARPLVYDPRFPVDTSWDLGVRDLTVILFWQSIPGGPVRLIDFYEAADAGIDHFAEIMAGKPYYYRNHIAPHDIEQREWGNNAVSRIAQAEKFGIRFERIAQTSKQARYSAGASLTRRLEINIAEEPVADKFDDCAHVLQALRGYHFKFDKERMVLSKDTVHDWTSHYADAYMEYALWQMQMGSTQRFQALQGRMRAHPADNMRLDAIMRREQNKNSVSGAWG